LTTLASLEIAEPYPYAWEVSLCRTLARQLLDRSQQRTLDLRAKFRQALRDRPSESIEDLLQNRALAHTFISFNYDLVLDHAIEQCTGGLDLPEVYGFRPVGGIVSDPTGSPFGAQITALRDRPSSNSDISILKPHGSLNWWARAFQTGTPSDEIWRDATVVIPITEAGCVRYVLSTDTHQWVQNPGELGFLVEPVILTPRSAKKPEREFLAKIREQEEEAICSAEEVFILGWSIPRTDIDQECLIRNAVSKRAAPFRRVTVVNRDAGVDYFKRVKDIFEVGGQSLLRICNSGFEEFSASQASAAY
jgi:hypothetical protein